MNTARPQKIVFFEQRKGEKTYLSKRLEGHKLEFCKEKLSESNVHQYKDADVVCVFINSELNSTVLAKMSDVKYVATRSTGYDHIDLGYCRKRDLLVSNVPSYGENTVAEHAMALLLSLTRRIPESIDRVRSGNFTPEGLTGVDLKGKVVGVMGTGHIGLNFVKMALGFSMRVLAYDLYPKPEMAEKMGFAYVEPQYLFAKSDFISLHLPYTKDTHHIINRKNIEMMKKGVVVINTARGGLIETDALFDALRTGQVGGAGLDVLEEEGFLKEEMELLHRDTEKDVDFKIALENHMMSYLPNVIITPHNAFNSDEALQRILDTTVDNILGFCEGKPINLVTVK